MNDATVPRPRRWPIIVLAMLGIAAVGFAVGRFTMFGTAADAGPAIPNEADAGFARDMQVHHAQAVEMAMIIYRETEDEEIRALSYDIATGQAAQRGEMFDWLVQWDLPQAGDLMVWMTGSDAHAAHGGHAAPETATEEELMADMGMASTAEIDALEAATGTAADCQFLELMIRHHEGALPMAEAVIELGSVARVQQVAQTMSTNQSAEIDAMAAAQARLGCS